MDSTKDININKSSNNVLDAVWKRTIECNCVHPLRDQLISKFIPILQKHKTEMIDEKDEPITEKKKLYIIQFSLEAWKKSGKKNGNRFNRAITISQPQSYLHLWNKPYK